VRGKFENEIGAIYSNFYPRKEGKQKGIQIAAKDIKTDSDLMAFERAVIRYKDHCAKNATQPKYIKHFSSFTQSWREWCDPETGSASNSVDAMMDEMRRLIEDGA
jgi:hypothetical protein